MSASAAATTTTTAVGTVPSVAMHNGAMHPLTGFGTYKVGVIPASASASADSVLATRDPKDIIKDAITAGYRYFDCAEFYGNETMVGEALKESGVPREQLYLAGKMWTTTIYNGDAAVRAQVEKSLADLQTDYLDLFLVHWPVPGKHVAAYKVLEAMKAEGKLRNIGVSNYTIEDYQELMKATDSKPVVNQIECNPFLYRKNTLAFFAQEGVLIQSYRAMRQAKEFSNAAVLAVAKKHGRTAPQVLGRWCTQRNIIVLAKTSKIERMRENISLFDFDLDEEDLAALDALTSPEALETYRGLYEKCVCRDTPNAEAKVGLKKDITID